MSGDVTPESLRRKANLFKRFDGDGINETEILLRAAADRITELEAALAERDATIAAAPHDYMPDTCPDRYGDDCTCWKSAAPGDALTAHDAEVWDAAVDASKEWPHDPKNPYREAK